MLGDGTQIDRNIPVRVIEENATGISCGNHHSFVTDAGWLFSHLEITVPIELVSLETMVISLAHRWYFLVACKRLRVEMLTVFFLKPMVHSGAPDSNKYRRVGAGEWSASVQPTKIVESGVAGISAGKDHSIYWTTNGEVYVFGSNREGQLGLPGRTLFTHEKQVLYDPNQ